MHDNTYITCGLGYLGGAFVECIEWHTPSYAVQCWSNSKGALSVNKRTRDGDVTSPFDTANDGLEPSFIEAAAAHFKRLTKVDLTEARRVARYYEIYG